MSGKKKKGELENSRRTLKKTLKETVFERTFNFIGENDSARIFQGKGNLDVRWKSGNLKEERGKIGRNKTRFEIKGKEDANGNFLNKSPREGGKGFVIEEISHAGNFLMEEFANRGNHCTKIVKI